MKEVELGDTKPVEIPEPTLEELALDLRRFYYDRGWGKLAQAAFRRAYHAEKDKSELEESRARIDRVAEGYAEALAESERRIEQLEAALRAHHTIEGMDGRRRQILCSLEQCRALVDPTPEEGETRS